MVYLLSSMNRGELVQSLVEETGLPKNVVRAVVNALPTVVAKGIREGESISMKGFGSFVPCNNPSDWHVIRKQGRK